MDYHEIDEMMDLGPLINVIKMIKEMMQVPHLRYLQAWRVCHSILVSCSQALASLGSLATKTLDALANVLAFLAATI